MTNNYSIPDCVTRLSCRALLVVAMCATPLVGEQALDKPTGELFSLISSLRESRRPNDLEDVASARQIETELDRLEVALRQLEYGDDESAAEQVATIAGWLSTRGIGSDLVSAIDQRYRLPNIRISFSENLLNAMVASDSHYRSPFREVLLGTLYTGNSTTDSKFSLRTNTAEDRIALTLLWQATVASRSYSSTRRVDVSSRSTTHIKATKKLLLLQDGWHLEPAVAVANTKSRIIGVSMRRLLGRRVARQKVYRQQAGVQRAVARRAEQRTGKEFDRQIEKLLSSWQDRFDRQLRLPLIERDQFPKVSQQRSTSSIVELALLQANRRQFGAVSNMPIHPVQQSATDLSFSVHQSACNNFSAGTLAGEQFREDQLAEQVARLLGWTPEGFKPADKEALWTIHFHKESPLAVEFADGSVTLTIQAQGFTVGAQSIPSARLEITYDLSIVDSRLRGVRKGRISIVPLEHGEESSHVGVRYQVFRSMLRRRFDRFFPPEFTWDKLPLPVDWSQQAVLTIDACQATEQWLQLSCRLTSSSQVDKLAQFDVQP